MTAHHVTRDGDTKLGEVIAYGCGCTYDNGQWFPCAADQAAITAMFEGLPPDLRHRHLAGTCLCVLDSDTGAVLWQCAAHRRHPADIARPVEVLCGWCGYEPVDDAESALSAHRTFCSEGCARAAEAEARADA